MKQKLDLLIIGGGITGITSLYWAKKRGLKARLLEKAPDVGGIWRILPAWQDIQMRADEWTLNGLPIRGIKQRDILDNIRSWVSQYDLGDLITKNCAVTGIQHESGVWNISTTIDKFQAQNVIVATGLHNDPFIPNIPAENSPVFRIHSSKLHDSKSLSGKRVAVLGSGASSLDAIDLAFSENAKEVHWIYRSPRWMVPSSKPKDYRPALRILARNQMLYRNPADLYQTMEKRIREKYKLNSMTELEPNGSLDLAKTQLVAGRPLLTTRFKEIKRHPGNLQKVVGTKFHVGEITFDADILIYATGYLLNLKFLGLPEFSQISSSEEMSERCGTYVRSLDYPNLFFLGPTVLDINGAAPLLMSMISRTVMAHIQRKCEIPKTVYHQKPVHWNMLETLAAFDHYNFWPVLWRLRYAFKAWYYNRYPQAPIYFP